MLIPRVKRILVCVAISRAAILFAVAACLTLICTSQTKAQTTLYFDVTSTFSDTAGSGSLSATFTDETGASCGVSGSCIQLVITSNLGINNGIAENLDPGKALYLNFDPSDSVNSLTFAIEGSTGGFNQAATVSSVGCPGTPCKADGTGGEFDLLFTYSTKAFVGGTSQTYLITSSTDAITASDFTTFYSLDGKPSDIAAIHVQNTGQDGTSSGWVSGGIYAPEPASMLLFGTGLFAIGGILRRRKSYVAQPV